MKFLLVDDSRTMRNIWKKVITGPMADAQIFEAGDGVEGLAAIAANGPIDLILLDWNMPNMDGITMARKVREADKTTPIIICTTEAEKSRVLEALKAGVNNYVVKPFTPDALLAKINETLKRVAQPTA